MNTTKNIGVRTTGVVSPIIKPGDNLIPIVCDSVMEAFDGKIPANGIVGVTEAVVAIAQRNFATQEQIVADLMNKFPGVTEIAIVDPIMSRNRFLFVLKAIAAVPTFKKIKIFLSYPRDEVGNPLITEEMAYEKGVNPYEDVFTKQEFYEIFGEPYHPFTGQNYTRLYEEACGGKAEIYACANFAKVPEYCSNVLVCSIHRRNLTKRILVDNGASHVLDLADILNESINGSGYNPDYGLYGTNAMADGSVKLMPINCQQFVEELSEEFLRRTGVHVEVFIFGDGCFKDSVSQTWELADPVSALAYTSGLAGVPEQAKLKFIASRYPDKTSEEIKAIIAAEKAKRIKNKDIKAEESLGTTPRQIPDLLGSISDLTTGSGDMCTPVVFIENYPLAVTC